MLPEPRSPLRIAQVQLGESPGGIFSAIRDKIFDPFWQVEQKATRRATGTGLGLTVCRRLANLMGGDIAVISSPGEGTTFTVTLPMKAPHIGTAVPARTAHLRVG